MDWEAFETKLKKWREFSGKSRWLRLSAEPPAFRLLWKLKLQVRPPHFINPILLAIFSGTAWGLSMFLVFLALFGENTVKSYPVFVVGGAMFGVFLAIWIRVERRIWDVPRWEDI